MSYRGLKNTKIHGVDLESEIRTLTSDKVKFGLFLQNISLEKNTKIYLLKLFSGENIKPLKVKNFIRIGRDITNNFQNIDIENFVNFPYFRKLFSEVYGGEIEAFIGDIKEFGLM